MLIHRASDVNGVRLHYVTAGDGPLILFLHGFPEFWYAWKRQLEDFGRDYLAVAPDMRGYNRSGKPAEVDQYRMPLLVEDVRQLAQQLGAERFTLVGHDWGGAVAWAVAATHPEIVERLVIINAPHPTVFQRELRENPAQQRASRYMLHFRGPTAEADLSANHYARLVDIVLAPGIHAGYFDAADREAYLAAWSQPGALTGGLNYYRAAAIGPDAADHPQASRPVMIGVPTLVLWGEQDTYLLTGNLDGLDRYVPDLTVRRIPDGSHWVIHEQPALVNAAIRSHLQERPEG